MAHPSISIIIPTLNSTATLSKCLSSIHRQNYPKNKLEILIIDAFSTDNTINIAKKYQTKILKNPKKTAESGKAIGLKHAKGKLIAFIDSDNLLPNKNWLKTMVASFQDKQIIASEPIKFTYRPQDPPLTRYFAMLGAKPAYWALDQPLLPRTTKAPISKNQLQQTTTAHNRRQRHHHKKQHSQIFKNKKLLLRQRHFYQTTPKKQTFLLRQGQNWHSPPILHQPKTICQQTTPPHQRLLLPPVSKPKIHQFEGTVPSKNTSFSTSMSTCFSHYLSNHQGLHQNP